MIVIVDYGMGNLRSAQKGLEKAGHEAVISEDPRDVEQAAGIVLPGVGAFGDCYEGLCSKGFVEPLLAAVEAGRPLLGICVGMQLLFDESEEGSGSQGLGVLPGRVVRFPDPRETGLKVPHMGWNRLNPVAGRPCPLLDDAESARSDPRQGPYVYFVHSYYAVPAEEGLTYATAGYGVEFAAMVGRGPVFAVQFHPEKSQGAGIRILKAFGDYVHHSGRSAGVRT